ncbi:MAG: 50S ribosomal protein L29 [Candidatus Marinimicrobia bacterium]|nr:50S ribosomal protein L29 [Candidatus Neomarinimicrobiota bacterium]
MKKEQLRELSVDELKAKLHDDTDALENLRFQKAMQQLENPIKIREIRREIAQIKTVLREYEIGIRK